MYHMRQQQLHSPRSSHFSKHQKQQEGGHDNTYPQQLYKDHSTAQHGRAEIEELGAEDGYGNNISQLQ